MLYLVLKSVWYKPYNCPQKEFCRLFLQKEMTEFWHQECWQIAGSAAHLSLDWRFNHWKCTTRLGSKEQKRRTYSFSKALEDELKFEMQTLFFLWYSWMTCVACSQWWFPVLRCSFSSEKISVYWSGAFMVWCHFHFSFNFFTTKVVFRVGTCCVNKILFVQGMNSACYSCCNLSTCSGLVFRTLSREIMIHWSLEILSKSRI